MSAVTITPQMKTIMGLANGVLVEVVQRGEVENTREAKLVAYEEILTTMLKLAGIIR